jgi:hypothetical protein
VINRPFCSWIGPVAVPLLDFHSLFWHEMNSFFSAQVW